MKVEYSVRPVTRFIIHRYEETETDPAKPTTSGSSTRGEFDNADQAWEVAYALAKAEHERLGYPVGDERIVYPTLPREENEHADAE